MSEIPLVDLGLQHRQIADEVAEGFARVIEENAFILGPAVAEFEDAFATFVGVAHCVGVASGTDALELALRAIGVGHGDEVILPANTFIATALAVARTGAAPVLVDCGHDHLIDADQIESQVTAHTRAVLPVHLYGQMALMEDIEGVAERHGLAIVEDAAQAHGANRNGRSAGSIGAVAGTSFYPGKNLGAYGDAGAVLTRSAEIAAALRALRNYGSDRKYHHPQRGFNSRLDTLQAVVLRAKLRFLDSWNGMRRVAAGRYDELLEPFEWVIRPVALEGNDPVWHLYVVRVPNRDAVLRALHEAGIGAAIHYPVPIHLSGAFRSLGYGPGSFPVAEELASQVLSLPLFPGITEVQQARIAEVFKGF